MKKSLVMKLKCFIDYKIKNNEENIEKKDLKAIKTDNTVSYEDDNERIKLIINNKDIIMEKDNLSSTITMNFKNNEKTKGKYLIKPLNSYLDMTINTEVLEISDSKIYIEYEIWLEEEYTGKFKYEVIIKEV